MSSRATKYFLRDLTSIDPPEVKAFYPIFTFGDKPNPNTTPATATTTSPQANDAITNKTSSTAGRKSDSITDDLTNTNDTNTTKQVSTNLINLTDDELNPPHEAEKTTFNETPTKHLNFSTNTDDTDMPLSSIKMAPIKKSTPATTKQSALRKSSTKSKVVISSAEPDVRCYTKGSPAMKEPGGTLATDTPTPPPPHNHKHKTVFEMSITNRL